MKDKARHKRSYHLIRKLVSPLFKWKFNYSYPLVHDVEGPYIVLANHNLELDPIIVGAAAGQQLYFVASEHLSRKGFVSKLLNRFLQPIYHYKGRAGAHTVKAILKTLRSGSSVCLFPEGNRSFNGLTCPIPPATGKMARRSGAKLVTYRFDGQYLTPDEMMVHIHNVQPMADFTDYLTE